MTRAARGFVLAAVAAGCLTSGATAVFAQGCPVTLSPPSAAIPANGGQATFTVNATGQNCSYLLFPEPGVTVVDAGSGNVFPASFTVSLGPNTTAGQLTRSVEVSSAGVSSPASPRVLLQQNGPPVTTDTPPGGLVFAVHRGAGLPHITEPEPVRITNAENPTATWTATTSEPWLVLSETSGTSPSVATLSIDPAQAGVLSPNTYFGFVEIVSPVAPQTVQRISVLLRITDATSFLSAPMGLLETPAQNATGLSGAVAVTGWATDDVGIRRVQIFRNATGSEPPGEIFIGDATRVRGARPDIVAALSGRPELATAGWGLMILSNVLPNGGNGVFTLTAYADDIDNHRVQLGQRTVTFDNTNSIFPFGTIDFPAQGGTMTGTYLNQGWILAQPQRSIPFDGSTIRLIVDGAIQPNVAFYNTARPDVSALFPFPPYINSSGPAARFSIDTTQFTNGLHTMVWLATDDNGVTQGIGSRFVSISNPSGGVTTSDALEARSAADVSRIPQAHAFVWDRKGFDEGWWSLQFAGGATNEVRQPAGERLEVAIDTWWWSKGCGPFAGYLLTHDVAGPVPPGSSLDGQTGVFTWMPPAEFSGTFELVFVRRACTGREERIPLRVVIEPR
jgi:hypothetical protein